MFDIASVLVESLSGDQDMASILTSANVQDLLTNLYAALNLLGPIAFGYVGNGLGFGFLNNSSAEFTSTGTATIEARIGEQFVFAGGYSFRIPLPAASKSTLDIGALFKASVRLESTIASDMIGLISAFSDPLGFVMASPLELALGAGIDLGLRFDYNGVISVGLVGRNLYSPAMVYTYSSTADFIASGTSPCGTTHASKLGRWLQPGDVVELEIEGIGVIRNEVVKKSS